MGFGAFRVWGALRIEGEAVGWGNIGVGALYEACRGEAYGDVSSLYIHMYMYIDKWTPHS